MLWQLRLLSGAQNLALIHHKEKLLLTYLHIHPSIYLATYMFILISLHIYLWCNTSWVHENIHTHIHTYHLPIYIHRQGLRVVTPSFFCFVLMRSIELGCFRSRSSSLWKALEEEGCIGLVSWRLDLRCKSPWILNDFFNEN